MKNNNYNLKDFANDQEIKWCPGCGDYSILKQVQSILPNIGISKEKIVFISGIGCSSRFPYYMNTYGMHSIHGRATAVATGLKSLAPVYNPHKITPFGSYKFKSMASTPRVISAPLFNSPSKTGFKKMAG